MQQKRPSPKVEPAPAPRTVTILGATGSIGASTTDLLRRDPKSFRIEAVTAHRDATGLARLAREFGARFAAVADPAAYQQLKSELSGSGIEAGSGPQAIVEAAQRPADWVMAAITGAASLAPTMAVRRSGAPPLRSPIRSAWFALALCLCGVRARRGATVLPVDSEHNAIFQALSAGPPRGSAADRAHRLGRGRSAPTPIEAIRKVTVEQALKHPTWSMGPKITVDSATLMNKGLELIEAGHLFAVPPEMLDVVVHPQSIIHGLVEFRDGSVIAQLGSPDMRIPISHCLAWPVAHGNPRSTARSCKNSDFDLRGTRHGPVP